MAQSALPVYKYPRMHIVLPNFSCVAAHAAVTSLGKFVLLSYVENCEMHMFLFFCAGLHHHHLMCQVQINHGRIATVKVATIKRTSWSIWAGEITAATKVCSLLFKKKQPGCFIIMLKLNTVCVSNGVTGCKIFVSCLGGDSA